MQDRLRLTFEPEKIASPVICEVAKKFDVSFSIRRADVQPNAGWMDLELNGEEAEIERAIEWIESQGVRVTPVGGDVLAG